MGWFHEESKLILSNSIDSPLWASRNCSLILYNAHQEECNINIMTKLRWKEWQIKNVKICKDIKESNYEMQSVIYSNNNGDQNISTLPWLLTKEQSKDVKEVIWKIKFPTGFSSDMKNILTNKGELSGVKNHDWHTFIKVIILVYTYLYSWNMIFLVFFSILIWD